MFRRIADRFDIEEDHVEILGQCVSEASGDCPGDDRVGLERQVRAVIFMGAERQYRYGSIAFLSLAGGHFHVLPLAIALMLTHTFKKFKFKAGAAMSKKDKERKRDKGEKENGKVNTKGKGKENITPTETPSAGSPGATAKMSWAQLLGGS